MIDTPPVTVKRYHDVDRNALASLLRKFGLTISQTARGRAIPGSFWGDSEAGLVGNTVHVRDDTPLHSILHEAAHYICMDPIRRESLHTNAGGDYEEENAVCFLQILMADTLPDSSAEALMADMDAWGYSFRLGSTKAWFLEDADDAHDWLIARSIIEHQPNPPHLIKATPLPALTYRLNLESPADC